MKKRKIFRTYAAVIFCTAVLILLACFLYPLSVRAAGDGSAEIGEMKAEDMNRSDADHESMDEMISWLSGQMEEGMLATERDIRAAISLGEEKFGITIPDEMTEALITTVEYVQSVGLDSDYLVEQAAKLWQEYGNSVTAHGDSSFWEKLWNAVKDFFISVWNFIVDFVKGLIEVIFG